jgi:hypothetical protein
MKAKTPRFVFQVKHDTSGRWATLEITVYGFREVKQFDTTETTDSQMVLSWQADTERPGRWYAGKVNIIGSCTFDALAMWSTLGRKLPSLYSDPPAVLAALEAAGAEQAGYSATRWKILPVSWLPAVGTRSYRDSDNDGGCMVHAYVWGTDGTETDAVAAVGRAYAAYVAKHATGMARFEAWIQAGKPVAYMDTEREHPAPWRTLFPAEEVAKAG